MAAKFPAFRRAGFTLIELLVVVAIITLLLGMLIPAIQKVRMSSQRVSCASNMRQIGLAMEMYKQNHRGRYPDAVEFPFDGSDPKPTLVEILLKYAGNDVRIFRCPSDRTWFEKAGISYSYPSNVAGKTTAQLTQRSDGASHDVNILLDGDNFHGPKNSGYERNYLYADGHVDTEFNLPGLE